MKAQRKAQRKARRNEVKSAYEDVAKGFSLQGVLSMKDGKVVAETQPTSMLVLEDKLFRLKSCGYCDKVDVSGKIKKCSACSRVSYCSKVCQKSDWKMHKKHCKPMGPKHADLCKKMAKKFRKAFQDDEGFRRSIHTFRACPPPRSFKSPVFAINMDSYPAMEFAWTDGASLSPPVSGGIILSRKAGDGSTALQHITGL